MEKKYIYSVIIIGILAMSYAKIKNNKHTKVQLDDHTHMFINYETSDIFAAVIEANKKYQSTYVAPPSQSPTNRVAVVTCMDSRIDLAGIMGPEAEKMFVLRNGGGRVSEDTLRSLTLAHKLLGVEQIFLIHHTDCGLQKITNKAMNDLLQESLFKADLRNNCNVTLEPLQDNNLCQWENKVVCGGHAGIDKRTDWLPIEHGLYESVLTDVKKIRNCSFLPSNVPIYGFIFNITTGALIAVPEALEAGMAQPVVCQ